MRQQKSWSWVFLWSKHKLRKKGSCVQNAVYYYYNHHHHNHHHFGAVTKLLYIPIVQLMKMDSDHSVRHWTDEIWIPNLYAPCILSVIAPVPSGFSYFHHALFCFSFSTLIKYFLMLQNSSSSNVLRVSKVISLASSHVSNC